jgi:hypothetical protein
LKSNFIIIPMDRLGVTSIQKSAMKAISFANKLRYDGKDVKWLTKPERLVTEHFPEGHLFSPGGFIFEYDELISEELRNHEVSFDVFRGHAPSAISIKPATIAFYTGRGAADFCTVPLSEVMELSGFKYVAISDEDIRKDMLSEFDIFLVPGGPDAGESYYWGLGDKGYEAIKDFMLNKGNYFGICAGAYLPLTPLSGSNNYWLGTVKATDDQDLDYWRTGTGFTRLKITGKNHPFSFGLTAGDVNTIDIIHWEGPALRVLDNSVKVLATYDSFIASGAVPERPQWDLLDNTPAIDAVNNWYNVLSKERFDNHLKGKGAVIETTLNDNKVLLYSPHAEFGNIGICERKNSQVFQLVTNGLLYLSL